MKVTCLRENLGRGWRHRWRHPLPDYHGHTLNQSQGETRICVG